MLPQHSGLKKIIIFIALDAVDEITSLSPFFPYSKQSEI